MEKSWKEDSVDIAYSKREASSFGYLVKTRVKFNQEDNIVDDQRPIECITWMYISSHVT
jgi:hypothetical protein